MFKKLTWDQTGERLYETGVKKGVLYPQELCINRLAARQQAVLLL